MATRDPATCIITRDAWERLQGFVTDLLVRDLRVPLLERTQRVRVIFAAMSALAGRRYTYQDYLDVEALGHVRHEYLDGEIFAMAGGTPEHAALAATLIGMLYRQLRDGDCRAYRSDLRLRVEATGLTTYPDAAVVCGPGIPSAEDANALTNPRLVFEVLSPSTEAYDRGDKRLHYQAIPTVEAVVLVQTARPEVEVWLRRRSAFIQSMHTAAEQVPLPGDLQLDLVELYTSLPAPPPER